MEGLDSVGWCTFFFSSRFSVVSRGAPRGVCFAAGDEIGHCDIVIRSSLGNETLDINTSRKKYIYDVKLGHL